MNIDVVLLPRDLTPQDVEGRVAIVFDVLRATTSITAALAAGVKEIRIFGDTASALAARKAFTGPVLLCGEEKALPPLGFDLGNSPRQFSAAEHAGRTVLLSTTNGTRAILAASGAAGILIGSLVNASAVARAAVQMGRDITLLCAGTNGQVAAEDLIGCGGVLESIRQLSPAFDGSDNVLIARTLFHAARNDLTAALRQTHGGRNVIAVNLEPDIDFSAKLDSLNVVGHVSGQPPIVRLLATA